MSPIVTKPEFRAPSDILEKEVARLNVPLGADAHNFL
jgi:hypothetical protein